MSINTSAEAIKQLQAALANANTAANVIDGLITDHDYQDVALRVAQAAAVLLDGAVALMQNRPDDALDALERTDDLLDEVYNIIDAELDDDE